MAATQTPYVEYIKISRTDELGQDLTFTLEALTQIKLPFTNGVSTTYRIASTTRYSDYFLFGILKTATSGAPAPSAADAATLDYNFTSSLPTYVNNFVAVPGSQTLYPTSTTGPNTQLFNTVPTSGYNTVGAGGDGGAYYGNGIILKTYPTTQIEAGFNITASVTTGQFTFRLYRIINGVLENLLQESALITTGTTSLTISTTTTGEMGVNDGFSLFAYNGAAPASPANEVNFTFSSTSNFFASSSAASGPTLDTIPEPFLKEQFKGTDCDVLLNNIDIYPPNPFLQDIDYSGNPFIPVNFNQLISGSAAKGTVPESYYTALSQTNIRYNGSKIQSSDINVYDPNAGTSSFGEPINIGTYGQTPSVTALDNVIAEFEWVGGASPEIPGGAQFSLSNRLFEVSSKELVKVVTPDENVVEFGVKNTIKTGSIVENNSFIRTISQSRGDYYQVLNSTFGPGKQLIPFDYGKSVGEREIPAFATIVDNTQWVPGVSSFASTSSYANGAAGSGFWIPGTSIIRLNGELLTVETQITEFGSSYTDQTAIDVSSTGWVEKINYSLETGNRWFITLLKNFEFPVSVDASNRFTDVQNGSELNKLGVFEILGIQQGVLPSSGGPVRINVDVSPTSFPSMEGTGFTTLSIGTWSGVQKLSNIGFVIWKSRSNYSGRFITVDETARGIQDGAFYSRFATDVVREEFENITKEYGNNTSS